MTRVDPPGTSVRALGCRPDVHGQALERLQAWRASATTGSSNPAVMSVVTPAERATGTSRGESRCTCESITAGVAISPWLGIGHVLRADREVHAARDVRVPGATDAGDAAVLDAEVALHRRRAAGPRRSRFRSPCRAPTRSSRGPAGSSANASSSRSPRAPDRRARSGPPRSGSSRSVSARRIAVARRRTVAERVLRAGDPTQASGVRPPRTPRASTSRVSPGAQRIESPAGRSSRNPSRRVAVERERGVRLPEREVRRHAAPGRRRCSSRRPCGARARAASGTSPLAEADAPGPLRVAWPNGSRSTDQARALVEQHLEADLRHQVRDALETCVEARAPPSRPRRPRPRSAPARAARCISSHTRATASGRVQREPAGERLPRELRGREHPEPVLLGGVQLHRAEHRAG